MDIEKFSERLRAFARDRDREQFHAPKNLGVSVSIEAAEPLEHFQWMTLEESSQLDDEKLEEVGDEIADVLIYLVRLADVLRIDLEAAADRKLASNDAKYPASRAKGSSKKYTEYE